jgi:hypothetical protein
VQLLVLHARVEDAIVVGRLPIANQLQSIARETEERNERGDSAETRIHIESCDNRRPITRSQVEGKGKTERKKE